MDERLVLKKAGKKGYGVFLKAFAKIKKGQVVGEFRGKQVQAPTPKKNSKLYYLMKSGSGYLDAAGQEFERDFASRYVNANDFQLVYVDF